MAKIDKYEDLQCWQKSRKLVNCVFDLIETPSMKNEYALADQLKRASISVMTNIAEGFNRYHKKDFIRFLDYAQSSAQEVKSLLYIVADRKMADNGKVEEIQNDCDHCQALILALLKHIKSTLNKNSGKTRESDVYYLAEELVAK